MSNDLINSLTVSQVDQLPDRIAEVHPDIDQRLLNLDDMVRVKAIYREALQAGDTDHALDVATKEIERVIAARQRPFCPECGSHDLIELRDATAYMKVVAVTKKTHEVVCEPDHAIPPSIFETAELWRCEICDFETDNQMSLVATSQMPAPNRGRCEVSGGIHAEATLLDDLSIAAKVQLFHSVRMEWRAVVGPNRDTFPLPVPTLADRQLIDDALQLLVERLTRSRDEIERTESTLEAADPYQLGDLFDAVNSDVAAEIAPSQLAN